ncbi:MAG: ABC transporter permease [Bacteroidales bacterium]|nr:ABC transporter permease [Bacteroidales bacterium]MBN2699152.1 ABC transporter permease [Bacteroidales bacterium]
MNTELFIARRIIGSGNGKKSFSRSIVGIAIFGIALGLAVMIVAVSIVTGFKKEISEKVIGFGSHITILNLDSNLSYETIPIPGDLSRIDELKNNRGIRAIQPYAIKAGIIKTQEEILGAVLKGIDSGYNWEFIEKHLEEGHILRINDSVRLSSVMISREVSNLLKLNMGDSFTMYFIQDPPRARTFTIEGIYNTSLEEYDKLYIFCDIKQIQRLNSWGPNQITGYEILLKNINDLETIAEEVRDRVSYDFLEDGSRLKVETILQRNTQIFDWLNLQDMNVAIIIILMLIVAGFNMISGLLIIILERTNMIGILKALGTNNLSIRKIFIYQSGYLALTGLLWGNLIGLFICLIQKIFHVIKLDPSSYYLDVVPINLNLIHLFLLNIGTALIIFLFLLLPSMIISRISPEKSIRFN